MKAKWFGMMLAAAWVAAACGEGRAIFNVDVLSFLVASGDDTVQYDVPATTPLGVPVTFDSDPVEATLLQLGSSTVDSVTIVVAANVENATGAGDIKFQLFFAADSASTFTGAPYAQDSAAVAGADTAAVGPVTVDLADDSLFANEALWVGVRVTATASAVPINGQVRLTTLQVRIVLRDEVF